MKKLSFTSGVTFVILLFATVLRLPLLGSSFWLDEAAQALESSRPFNQQLQIRDDFQPPLIHFLVFGLLKVSSSEAWLRFGVALIPGIITVWLTIQLGQQLFSRRTGWLAGLLLATSSFHIFYSQELRPYSLPTMFAGLSWLFLLKFQQQQLKKLNFLTLWGVVSGLGLYSSYLYFFVLLGQVIWLGWTYHRNRRALNKIGLALILVCLSFAPWIPSFFNQLHAGQQLRTTFPGWQAIVSFSQLKSFALVIGKFVYGVLDLSADSFFLVTGGLLVSGFGILGWLQHKKLFQPQQIMLFCWGVLPIVFAWVISFWIPILQPKRVLFALPAFYLFLTSLAEHFLSQKNQRHIALVIAAGTCWLLLLGINLFSALSYYTQPKYHREDWRGIHQLITQKYQSQNSIVVFAFPDQFASWKWYNRETHFPTASTGVFVLSADPAAIDRLRLKNLADAQYILVFDYLRDLTDPNHLIEKDLERFGYQEVDRITPETPLGIVRVYARTGQIIGFSEY